MIAALRTRPDRVLLAIAVLAWAWMLGEAATARRLSCCDPHPSRLADLTSWALMIAAMMLPATLPAARDVGARSYRCRRIRSVVEYMIGYAACWAPIGLAFVAFRSFDLAHDPRTAAAFAILAAAWAALPIRTRWFNLCHRPIPLCPVGWRADCDALRQGAVHGVPCVKMCWPLMFACAVSGHDMILMIGGAWLALAEKRMFRLNRRPLILGSLALAAWLLVKWWFINQSSSR